MPAGGEVLRADSAGEVRLSDWRRNRGVISYVRMFSGTIKAGDFMLLMSNNVKSEVKEVGVFMPKMTKIGSLGPGDVDDISRAARPLIRLKDARAIPKITINELKTAPEARGAGRRGAPLPEQPLGGPDREHARSAAARRLYRN